MGWVIKAAICSVLAVVCIIAAVALSFGVFSLYVNTSGDTQDLQPGSVRYETREFWLSLRDWIDGKEESWTAEWPDIIDADSR